MRWYTAIGMKKDDADGRFCVWVDGEEKVLTEMETILWAALTWSFCEEDKVHSQMHRLLVFSLGEKQAQEWADKEDFQFCLNRLVKRGLVVLTEGCTREEAVWNTTKAWMTGSFEKRKKETERRHKMVWSDKRETGIFFSFLFIWLKKPEERRKRCR